jgi:hypothetical protein
MSSAAIYPHRRRHRRALNALQTLIPSYIRDVVPSMIDGRPSSRVLYRLASMVRDDNCANVALDILMNDCNAIGQEFAKYLKCPQ